MLVGLIVSLVFRVAEDAFRDNPVAQERIIGATLTAMAITDVGFLIYVFAKVECYEPNCLICRLHSEDFIQWALSESELVLHKIYSVLSSLIGLPTDIRYDIFSWNGITHGNITFTTFVFCVRYVNYRDVNRWLRADSPYDFRLAWFMGVGRRRFYYGQRRPVHGIKSRWLWGEVHHSII